MIVFLFGKDSYRITKNKEEIISAYKKKYGSVAYERFDASELTDLAPIHSFLGMQSMFSPKKLAEINRIDEVLADKEIKALLKKYITDEDTIIIATASKKMNASYAFLRKEPVRHRECDPYTSEQIGHLIDAYLRKNNASMPISEKKEYIRVFGSDMWAIENELQKYIITKKAEIPVVKRNNYFGLSQKIKNGRTAGERIVALERLLTEEREDAGRIFNGLAYRLSSGEQAIQYANYDHLVKIGKLDYEEALLSIALNG